MADAEVEPILKDSESTDKSEKKTKKKTSTKKTKDSTKEKKVTLAEPGAEAPVETGVSNDTAVEDQSVAAAATEEMKPEVPSTETNDVAAPQEPQSDEYQEQPHGESDQQGSDEPQRLPIVEHPLQLKSPTLLEDIDESKLTELQEAFLLFDLNQDGYIDKNDLLATYRSLGMMDITEAEVTKMLAEATSPMDFDSFVTLLGYKTIELDPEETLIEALSKWDKDNSGFISEEQIRYDLMTWGDRFSAKEVDYALEEAPVYFNKKGKPMIDYINFCKSLSGLRKKKKVTPPAEGGENEVIVTEAAPNA